MTTTKFKLIIRKGSQLIQAWSHSHSTALGIARAYTDRGHEVALVSYPELEPLDITAEQVNSMLCSNA